jgi:hypothetical protein
MQELRGQGPAEEGRQGGQVPALQGDRRTVTRPAADLSWRKAFWHKAFCYRCDEVFHVCFSKA